MAGKIAEGFKEGFKEIRDNVVGAFSKPKYHNNLLGESLADKLRQATSKTLEEPSDDLNQQVVDTINQEISGGKDPKEAVGLLKKRLRTDNPQKQWLAVLLVGKVMRECSQGILQHQEELLQEVARVMARPAKPEAEAGKKTRHAAKDLLRNYGRAGTDAFRAANRMAVPQRARAGSAGGVDPALYNGAYMVQEGGVSSEKASVVAEMQMLIDQAKANTELLSDMLVNRGSGDEFEESLVRDLIVEVRDLRSLFTAYLEQLQGLDGPDVEAVVVQALEAADLLDNTLALEQEVLQNQVEGAGGAPGASTSAPATSAPQGSAVADLISLDDDATPAATGTAAATATTSPAPTPAAATDPFAALDHPPLGSFPTAQAAVSQPQPVPTPVLPPASASAGASTAAYYGSSMPSAGGPPSAPAGYSLSSSYPPAPAPGAGLPGYGQPAAPVPAQQPLPAQVFSTNNPFAGGMPGAYPAGAPPPSNPFAPAMGTAMPPPPAAGAGAMPSVDAEWDMFFAGRSMPVQNAAAVNADFEAMVAKK